MGKDTKLTGSHIMRGNVPGQSEGNGLGISCPGREQWG